MDSLLKDLRYGLRGLVRSPGFTLTAVLALALGIGANTAIFSVVNPVLFKALPYENPDRLIAIVVYQATTGEEGNVSFPLYEQWRQQARSFESLVATHQAAVAVGAAHEPIRAVGMFTTSNMFSLLGRSAAIGRALEESDDAPDATPVVVLSHWMWARHFNSNPRIVGQSVSIDGKPFTVIGVMPDGFGFPSKRHALWAPIRTGPSAQFLPKRGHHFLSVTGRLKEGVTPQQATAEMTAILKSSESDRISIFSEIRVVGYQGRATRELRPVARVLIAAVGFVLLIACANVANLLLARANGRQREFAVRLALGASRARLARQLVTESVLLSFVGGLVGLLLSLWMVDGLKILWASLPGPGTVGSPVDDIRIDGAVLAFTFAVALITGLAFGLAPAISGSRTTLHESLKDAGTRASLSRGRLRTQNALIAAQLALAFALLASAGLMIMSLVNLMHVNPGFNPENVVTMRMPLPSWGYSKERKRDFYRQVLSSMKALPGVVTAGGADPFPFADGNSRTTITIVGRPVPPPEELLHSNMYEVSPEYFEAMQIPILEGRTFTESERTGESNRVIIINRKFAQRFWPNESALGKRILMGVPDGAGAEDLGLEVVGVVGDVLQGALDSTMPPQFYVPFEFSSWMRQMIVVRTKGPARAVIPALRKIIREADPMLPVPEPELATSILEETTANRRVAMTLLGAFAALALALATFGLYGLITYSVGQRSQELAIRIALGGQPNDIVRLVLSKGLAVTAAGLGAGVALALVASRLLATLLYGVSATDAWTYLAIAVVLGGSALLATYIPARRATRVSPLAVLRAE